MINIGFTGTQKGLTTLQGNALTTWVRQRYIIHLHHGDCVGADQFAHNLALALGIPITVHPPTIETKRAFCQGATEVRPPAPYLTRNRAIVAEGIDGLVATPSTMTERQRSGTWATIRAAQKAGRHVRIFYPDGTRGERNGLHVR